MANVLLINPSYNPCYGSAKAGIVDPVFPTLGLATIAATALQRGHKVEILDLSWRPYDHQLIRDRILEYGPDIVGITATTPLMNQMRDISVLIKDISKDILCVGGGPHASALPVETLHQTLCDAVFCAESDYSFAEFCDGWDLAKIDGIYYRDGDQIVSTAVRLPIANLDDLPMPAWELYDLKDYMDMPHLLAKEVPITMAEFSRGCIFKCDFCASKMTMHQGYRKKSPQRCAEEVKKLAELGFREFMLADDIFTSDTKWAIEVCEAIIATGVKMHWSCTNGIRVESASDDVFQALRKAGCYRVAFGFETGNDAVLKKFGKGGKASIEQGRNAVRMARKAGIDTGGFFMLGLSPDTEESMMDTIEFARQLPVDMMKFGVTIAFPGTAMFNDYVRKGLIKSFEWDEYFIYTDEALFAHENMDFDIVKKYMKIAYKRAMLFNPSFVFRRFLRGIRTGELFHDAYYAFKFALMPTTSRSTSTEYYAMDRWPQWKLENNPPQALNYLTVGKQKASINA